MKRYIYVIFLLFLFLVSADSQWVPLGGGLGGDILDIAVFNSNIYAGGTAYLFRSTNNGDNWTGHMSNPAYAWSIAASGSNLYCGVSTSGMTMTAGIYKSTNNGINWSLIGLNNKPVFDLTGTDQELVAVALDQGDFRIFRSTNAGMNWVDIKGTLSLATIQVAVSGNRIYGGGQGLHVTTNYGTNWSALFMTDNIESISVSDSLIFIGTYSKGVYRSSNYGQSWDRVLQLNKRIPSVYHYGNNVFAGADTGFYVSTNNGLNFADKTQGLGNASISSIVIHNNYIFVSNSNYLSTNVSAWRRPLAEVIGIKNISTELPLRYDLHQNYPNPFNPSTRISFDVSPDSRFDGNGNVVLKIYNALGREISVLVNEQLQPGTYEVTWNANSYPSGVYFYKLTSGDFSQTMRMILLK